MLKLNEKLEDKEWKEIYLSGDKRIFNNFHGKRLTKDNRIQGNTPFLTAGEQNNGISAFISNSDLNLFKNVISIDMFGNSFFHDYLCSGDDNIYFFENKNISNYCKLFIVELINKNKTKFSYGKQFRQKNADTLKIMLPINEEGKPDYEYMEQYTKSVIDQKLEKYVDYAKSIINDLKTKEIEKLEDKEWKEFSIEELFDIKIGKNIDGNKINKTNGAIPYVTRKESNNGLDGFIDYDLSLLNKEFPVITIGNETATPFVQTSYKFFTGTKVNIMKLKDFESKEVLFFISQCIKQQKSKYSYSITINSTRLKKQKILLPINEEGKPDYEYMEQYIKNLMNKKVNQYLNYLQKTQSK